MVLVFIEYIMLFSYGYGWWGNWQWRTNAPPLLAILMATSVHRGNTEGIAQWGMSRATSEATGRRYWATTCSELPRWLPGQQANKQWWTNTPTLLAVLMAMAMCLYVTARITQWRRSRASQPWKTGHKKQLNTKVWRSKSSLFSCRVRCQECMGSM